MAGSERLRISLLGELAASHDGVQLELGGPRQRAVLALLVIARGEVVPADTLADSLWAGRPPGNAAGTLQSYISHLRRRLQPGDAARSRSGVIVSQASGYAVRLPVDAVDSWRFEQLLRRAGEGVVAPAAAALLAEALGLWRGPALVQYSAEAWAEPEVARLTELRHVARERWAAARLDCGEAALVVPELDGMVAEQPLREERWRLLALALYRANRQADALAALRRARATLADELGVDPGPVLRALENEVLAQSPGLDAPAVPAPAPSADPAAPAPPATRDLIDRDRELAALRSALDDVAGGTPRVVLVDGPAGIGKTRLLGELRRLAAGRGWRVLSARGSPLERAFGYGAVRQLLEPVITDDVLTGPAAAVFDLAGDAAEGSFAVLHGLYRLTTGLTGAGPLAITVDDVQWCDPASLRYLTYLVHRLDGLPVLVAASARSGEEQEVDDLFAELALDAATVPIRPQPLGEPAIGTLVGQVLGDPVAPLFVTACHRTTSGNPLLLRQLLQALQADRVRPDAAHAHTVLSVGSRAVSSQVLMRLRRMPADCVAVARAVAVLGEGSELPAVSALSGLAEPQAAEAVSALTRAQILCDDQPLGFEHPLVGDAVYRDLPVAERALRHERAAALLRATGASAEQVAAHLLLTPRRGDAGTVDVMRTAARTAAARGAADSALTYLRRALDEPPGPDTRNEVLLELGMQESLLDGPASTEHLLEAYHRLDDQQLRGQVAIGIAWAQVFAGEQGAALTFARDAAAELPEELDDLRQGLLALQRISGQMQGLDQALWRTGPTPEPAGDGNGARMLSAELAWEQVTAGVDRTRAVRLARAAHEGDLLWEFDEGLFWVLAAIVRMVADDDIGDFWQRARRRAQARGSLFAMLSINLWEGFWRWRRGELPEAAALVRAAHEQNRMWRGSGIAGAFSIGAQLAIDLDRGDLAAARRVADATPPDVVRGEGGRLYRQVEVRLLLDEGRFADALDAVDRFVDPTGIANPAWNPWRSLRASALHGLGRTAEAVRLLEHELALLRHWGAPSSVGLALTNLGTVAGSTAALREAVDVLAPTPAALLLARARLALGARPDLEQDEALPLLQAALDAGVTCGAPGLVRTACEVLALRGSAVRDVPRARVTPMSTAARVGALARQGRTVPEIARELFLSPATVQAALDEPAADPDTAG